MSNEVTVTASHFQILVGDCVAGPLVDTSTLWDSPAAIPSVPGTSALIALPIVRYGGRVHVEVEVSAGPVHAAPPDWVSLGTFELNIPSGQVLLWGPETLELEAAARIELPAGSYSGEAFSRDTELVSDENATDGPDRYRLVLWLTSVPC